MNDNLSFCLHFVTKSNNTGVLGTLKAVTFKDLKYIIKTFPLAWISH